MAKTTVLPASAMHFAARKPMGAIQGFSFSQIPGAASYAAAASDGSLWVLSTQPAGPDKYIWHYVNGTWTNISGLASRISVAPNGTLYAINSGGGAYSYSNGAWSAFGGGCRDLTAASDGSLYVISNGGGADGPIWHYTNGAWTQMPGAGNRLAASWDTGSYSVPGGTVTPGGFYVINSLNNIYYLGSSGYIKLAGAGSAVAPMNGGLFVLGAPADPNGNVLYYYDLANPGWSAPGGSGVSITTDGQKIYIISAAGGIYVSNINTPGRISYAYLSAGTNGVLVSSWHSTQSEIQVFQIEDANGNALAQPTYTLKPFPYYVMGMDATPDGRYGAVVYNSNGGGTSSVQLVSGFDSGNPTPIGTQLGLYSSVGDAGDVAMLPSGDRAIVTQQNSDYPGKFVSVAGILAGSPSNENVVPMGDTTQIGAVSQHVNVHVAPDGSYFMVRGGNETPVMSITKNGSTYSYAVAATLYGVSKNSAGQGNGGFAINPKNASQAIFVSGSIGNDIYFVTGLPSHPVVAQHLNPPEPQLLNSVQFTPDGKYAVIGGAAGLQVYGGFLSGSIARVGGLYPGTFTMEDGATHKVVGITSVGVTPDGKYVTAVVTDLNSAGATVASLVTIPIDANGNLGSIAGTFNRIIYPTAYDDIMINR